MTVYVHTPDGHADRAALPQATLDRARAAGWETYRRRGHDTVHVVMPGASHAAAWQWVAS